MSNLRDAARERNLSGRQIAALLGVTPPTISRWFSRKVVVPAEYVGDLANLLGVDPMTILPPASRCLSPVDEGVGPVESFNGVDNEHGDR